MEEARILFYEGHIRNWRRLCSELNIPNTLERWEREKKILLCGFGKWGTELPTHLIGMFSFAIIVDDKTFFCARDHFGIKPFYYCETKGKVLLSPKIQDILKNEDYHKELDEVVLQHFLSYTYIPGRNTLFKNIKKLMPGEMLLINDADLITKKYWVPEYNIDNSKTIEEWSIILENTIDEVMKEVIESNEEDHAVVLLSSGVDSSYILAKSNIKNTCTVGFFEEAYDESTLASLNAKLLGRNNRVRKISKEEFLYHTKKSIEILGLPIGTPATIAYRFGCELASENAKIFLSGEGADEFFCGYDVYKYSDDLCDGATKYYIGKANIMNEETKKSILNNYIDGVSPSDAILEMYTSKEHKLDTITEMSNVDIRVWLEGNSFLNVHRMSSACGIEARLPLVDVRIFNIISRIPAIYKVNKNDNKIVFRKCANKILPKSVSEKPKSGFVIPMRYWLLCELYEKEVLKIFNGEISKSIFNNTKLNELYANYKNGNLDLWKVIWNIYVFLVWYEIFFF